MSIRLINGPCNNTVQDDTGADLIRVGINPALDGERMGEAQYEPNSERTLAFWLDNQWFGKIVEKIPLTRT